MTRVVIYHSQRFDVVSYGNGSKGVMMTARSKPIEGHKFDRVRYGAEVLCECGWCSCVYYGKGSRSQAYAEWRSHLHSCVTVKPAKES